MCFSAAASFITAGITGSVSLVAFARAKEPHERPLAAIPLLFAVQQGIEGLLWLNLDPTSPGTWSAALIFAFLLFAEVFWPVYAPVAVWLIEPDKLRRHFVAGCIVIGTVIAAYFLWRILGQQHSAAILNGHIVYVTEHRQPETIGIAYVAATALPFLLSSLRTILALGIIILAGLVTAYFFYWEAFVSVWCFFAAAASIAILMYFETARRGRLRTAGT